VSFILQGQQEGGKSWSSRYVRNVAEARERFSKLMDRKRFRIVHPILPMDIFGLYVLLPDR
jgi:hypothetical protein